MRTVIVVVVALAVLGVARTAGLAESFGVVIAAPMLFGVVLAVVSVRSARRQVRARQVIMSAGVLFTVTIAEVTLLNMARGAWPTYLPYTLLGVATPVAALQRLTAGR